MFESMLDPTGGRGGPVAAGGQRAGRPDRLDGLVIGLLANTKRNAEAFLDAVAEQLDAEFGTAGVVRRRKTSIVDPVPAATLAEMAELCDVVVIGVGDCGSCSASAVADGIAFEAAGVPAAVICTDAFRVTATAMAGLRGDPDYRFACTQHPVAPLDADGVRERAAAVLPELVDLLTGAPVQVVAG